MFYEKITFFFHIQVTAFIVERSFGGVDNGPPEKKMGIKVGSLHIFRHLTRIFVTFFSRNILNQGSEGIRQWSTN